MQSTESFPLPYYLLPNYACNIGAADSSDLLERACVPSPSINSPCHAKDECRGAYCGLYLHYCMQLYCNIGRVYGTLVYRGFRMFFRCVLVGKEIRVYHGLLHLCLLENNQSPSVSHSPPRKASRTVVRGGTLVLLGGSHGLCWIGILRARNCVLSSKLLLWTSL